MKIVNVKYDINTEDVVNYLFDMSYEQAAEKVDVPAEYWANMHDDEKIDYIYDIIDHNRFAAQEILELPDTIELPDSDEWDEETVTDYLEDETGYYIRGWKYEYEA